MTCQSQGICLESPDHDGSCAVKYADAAKVPAGVCFRVVDSDKPDVSLVGPALVFEAIRIIVAGLMQNRSTP